MPQEETTEIKQPSPFGQWSDTPTVAPTIQEPISDDAEDTPTAEDRDPVIADKDLEIKEEQPTSDKPDEPLKTPSATPPPVQDLPDEKKKLPEDTFTSETSRKLYEAIKAGKEDEVYNLLSEKRNFDKLDTLKPEEVIKLNLKYQNKDFTDADINDLFEEKYGLPEKPEQGVTEDDEDFEAREKKYTDQVERANRRIEREAKSATTELQKFKQELVLPDIPQTTPEPQAPTQEELKLAKDKQEQFLQAVDGSLKDLNAYNATFKDEEVEIPVAYKISKQEKDNLKPLLDSLNTDLPQFFQQLNWIGKDGNLNMQKVVSDIHTLQNKDTIVQKFVNEAGNKRLEAHLKSMKNIDLNGQKRHGNLEPSSAEERDNKVRGFLAAS